MLQQSKLAGFLDAFPFRAVCNLHQCAIVYPFVETRPVCSLSEQSGFNVF